MRKVYEAGVPKNIKKAFAERLRQQRLKGKTDTEEYKRIMQLRSEGRISEEIARTAFRIRKPKVLRETKSAKELFEERRQWWINEGLEWSSTYQRQFKQAIAGYDVSTLLPTLDKDSYKYKEEKLNALLEENKTYIYSGAQLMDEASELIFEDMTDTGNKMFDENNIDEYISILENYKQDKSAVIKAYKKKKGEV